MLDPVYTSLIRYPTIFSDSDRPVRWETAVFVLRCKVIFTRHNDKRWNRPALRIDALNYRYPFPITRLHLFGPDTPVRAYHDDCGRDNAHHKPSFVKVVDIRIVDAVLRDCVPYQRKPATNDSWIFTLSPLIVVLPLEMCVELWAALDKVISLTRPNAWRVAYREKSVRYISHYIHPGRESFSS